MNGSGARSQKEILICGPGIMGYHIFGDGQYALLPFEFDPVSGIGRELGFARFCSKACDCISNRTSSLQLGHQ